MMLILPFVMAAFVMPNWQEAVHAAGAGAVWTGAAFGFGWGVGAVLFGYGVTMAGMSVGFATIMGINTAVGSLLPFLVKSPADLLTSGGLVILLGIAGCVAGVVVCGRAGFLRERQTSANDSTTRIRRGAAGLRGVRGAERLRQSRLCLLPAGLAKKRRNSA